MTVLSILLQSGGPYIILHLLYRYSLYLATTPFSVLDEKLANASSITPVPVPPIPLALPLSTMTIQPLPWSWCHALAGSILNKTNVVYRNHIAIIHYMHGELVLRLPMDRNHLTFLNFCECFTQGPLFDVWIWLQSLENWFERYGQCSLCLGHWCSAGEQDP